MKENKNIADKLRAAGILVSVTLGAYNPIKVDQKESAKIRIANHLRKSGLANVQKNSLPTSSAIDEIRTLDGQIRALVDKYGAPWSKGVRIVPSTLFLELNSEIRGLFAQRSELVAKFAESYVRSIAEAQRDLNGLFEPKDYPPADQVVGKFHQSFDAYQIPDTGLQVNAVGELAEALQISITQTFESKIQSIVPFLVEDMITPLVKLSEVLQNPEAEFKNTLLTNVLEAGIRSGRNNILDDDGVRNGAFGCSLFTHDPESLRTDKKLRTEVAGIAADVITSLGGEVPQPVIRAPRRPRAERSKLVQDTQSPVVQSQLEQQQHTAEVAETPEQVCARLGVKW